MTCEAAMTAELSCPAAAPTRPAWLQRLRQSEDLLVVAVLLAMIALPVIEIALRATIHSGITGSSAIVQHLTLAVGMLGGALAARDGRLLALSPVQAMLSGRWLATARIFSGVLAAVVSGALAVSGVRLVIALRPLSKILVYGVPVWTVQLIMPLGFAVIAWRLVQHSAESSRGRWTAAALTLGVAAAMWWLPVSPAALTFPALLVLAVATLLGAPVFTAIGGAALLLFWVHELPLESVPLKHYSLTTNEMLPTIPLFTLAGYFLAEGGASQRLVQVFQAFVGHIRGGPAIVTALACAFFTSFTGASGVTILALGGVLMPVLRAAHYSERSALGLLTGAGSLGMLFPPCLPLILYAIVAGQSTHTSVTIRQMFLGGIGPGLILVALTAWWGMRQGPRVDAARSKFQWRNAVTALWVAKWELAIPFVAIGALFTVPTTVEAAALTAAYALFVATVIHRDVHPIKDLPRVVTECGVLVGGVLLILGVALGFTHYLVDAQIPDRVVEWSVGAIKSKWVFLLGLNVVLLAVGGLVEIYAAIIVVVPLLVPVGVAFGLDPVHLGIVFLANMELGFLAPPIGLNLLLASSRFNRPMTEVMRAVLPILFLLFVGVLLITYVPALTTTLPRLFSSP